MFEVAHRGYVTTENGVRKKWELNWKIQVWLDNRKQWVALWQRCYFCVWVSGVALVLSFLLFQKCGWKESDRATVHTRYTNLNGNECWKWIYIYVKPVSMRLCFDRTKYIDVCIVLFHIVKTFNSARSLCPRLFTSTDSSSSCRSFFFGFHIGFVGP